LTLPFNSADQKWPLLVVEHFSVGFIEPPSEKCSVPRPVSTSSGDAMPGSIGVVSLYCFGGWEREVINSR
jgi:hypothetical protein